MGHVGKWSYALAVAILLMDLKVSHTLVSSTTLVVSSYDSSIHYAGIITYDGITHYKINSYIPII